MADGAITPSDVLKYRLYNANTADTIYPVVFNKANDGVIWDGSLDSNKALYKVQPNGGVVTVDLSQISTPPVNQAEIYFGATIDGVQTPVSDKKSVFKYVKTSTGTAVGHYLDQKNFKVDSAPTVFAATGLDSAALQSLFAQTNAPAVAKLFVAIANVISPEI